VGYTLIATENEVFKKGLYGLKVQGIEPKTSTLTEPSGQTKNSTYLRWTFDILKRGYEGKVIRANSSTDFGPSAKGRKWAEALLGRTLHVNEPVDTDDLIGLIAVGTIGIVKKGENQYNEIEAMTAYEPDEEPQVAPERSPGRGQQVPHPAAHAPSKANERVSLTGFPQDDDQDGEGDEAPEFNR
jgi:hypothetical protein